MTNNVTTHFWQDAEDFLTDRSRAWVRGLRINDDIFNDTPTRLIGMSPNEAVKKALKGKKIIASLLLNIGDQLVIMNHFYLAILKFGIY